MKPFRWSVIAISLVVLNGCWSLTARVDREISELAAQVDHVEIHPALDPVPAASEVSMPSQPESILSRNTKQGPPLHQVVSLQAEKKPPQRLIVPPGLPGADAPPITKFPEAPAERKRSIQELFPPLPQAPKLAPKAPGPEGRPMALADLQRLAAVYSPAIKSAEAAVEAAKGAAKQAGAYPNPTFFFEQDTVGTGPGGYEGLGFNQVVKTGNKLKLQQAAAVMDLLNARLALKRAYSDLAYQVRINYFAVLVAQENVKINEALYEFTNEIYRVQVEVVEGGQGAPYEPLQLRPLAIQARFNLIQAQNQYLASWRQLAATLGLRDMPPTELVGRVDMPVPVFEYNVVLARVLASHTDVLTTNNTIQRARFALELAKVTPVPDVTLNVLVQKDYTAPPNLIVHSLQFGFPVPIFDHNAGGIKQAEGLLAQAAAGPDQARNSLTITLADAFNRYKTAIENVDITMQQIRDQIRAYRALYARRQSQPDQVSFGDVVTAQQTLAGYIAGYVSALGLQWTAVNDVANLLQTDDLFQVGPKKEMLPVPDLKRLTPPAGLPPSSLPPAAAGHSTGNSATNSNGQANSSLSPAGPSAKEIADRRALVLSALVGLVLPGGMPPGPADDDLPAAHPKTAAQTPPAGTGASEELPASTPAKDRPLPFVLPPPPDYSAAVAGERWIGSSLLERPEAAPQGVFFNVESSVLWAHFSNHLQGGHAPNFSVGAPATGGLPITGDIVRFPGNQLDATVSPRFEFGYRFPDGFGELRLSYRFLDTRGADTALVAPPDANDSLGLAAQTGRLDINIIDLDFGTREFSLGPDWEMHTAVGMRYATAFLDSRVIFLNPVTLTGSPFGTGPFTRLSQTEALGNRYIGAHGVFEAGRKLWIPGLTLFGRLDGAGMYGRVHQTFSETFVEAPGFTKQRVTNGVGTPMLAARVGLSYDVPQWNHARFLIGYQFEEWWQFGRGDNDLSFGPLNDQGLFLRAEFNF
jgi:cobalt-zinc-cadmium efflux system outer membrane protein